MHNGTTIFKKLTILVGLCLFFSSCQKEKEKPSSKKPYNILFLIIDDLRPELGCYGGQAITPNLDKLAAQSMQYEEAYCQAPACAPSRASMMYGIRPSTSGKYQWQYDRQIPAFAKAKTFAEVLKDSGYYVMGTGKIHHFHPKKRHGKGHGPKEGEWDAYYPAIDSSMINAYGNIKEESYFQVMGNFYGGVTKESEEELSDYLHASWAIDRLKHTYDKPFFLGLGIYRPHLPFSVPQKYFDLYDTAQLKVYATDFDETKATSGGKYYQNAHQPDHEVISGKGWGKKVLHAYLASISFADAQVGRVMDELAKSPYAENTVVVVTSDHGWHLGEKSTYRKFTLWREACRVPLLVKHPDFAPGKTNKGVELLSLFPTFMDIARIATPDYAEGKSLLPSLKGLPNAPDQAITTWGKGNHAISTSGYRWIQYADSVSEWYDAVGDKDETKNLAEEKISEIKQLQKQLAFDSPLEIDGESWVGLYTGAGD